ncbi:ferredoxin [Actinophytocola oryzae]|uniref:Ferredoxin n=1 Tax=Actinophytocola oryzae TaxID=502181 RepID=A0A4R7VRP0_9PSEU|nr:ferredoxin [Actinophytocola oryzae]TDV52125.1 ferredoxin [Actinophytocola oryzae]
MTYEIRVDPDFCGATGMCAALAPDLFRLDGTYATPVKPEIEPDELALDAADQCPTQAILVTEGGREVGPRP